MKIIFTLFFAVSVVLISTKLSSCAKEKVPIPILNTQCTDTVSFQTTILPLIETNCSTSGCHDVSGAGGYVLTDHTQISNHASRIISTIRYESGFSPMPQGEAKLSDASVTQFNCWILQGKLNN